MPRARLRHCLSLLLLLSWQAPALAAVAMNLHLAAHEHESHDSSADSSLKMAGAAAHGHHHELDVPAHDHVALLVEPLVPNPEGGTSELASVISPVFGPAIPGVRLGDSPSRAGPPQLFYKNCALRL